MRDYILTQSIARDSTFAFPKLRRMIRSWVLKRNLKALEALDAHLLDDIGLARGDLRHLHALPLDVDLAEEYTRLRDARAHLGPHSGEEQRQASPRRVLPRQEERTGLRLGSGRFADAPHGVLIQGR
jgi:uncharacterized protein YjiS (DUF1127 family)